MTHSQTQVILETQAIATEMFERSGRTCDMRRIFLRTL